MIHELLHVLTDPAHWIAEVVMDGTLTLIAVYPIRRLVAVHDRRKHGVRPTPKPFDLSETGADGDRMDD